MATSAYVELARTLARDAFVASHPGCFLVKRPKPAAQQKPKSPGFGFATAGVKVDFDPSAAEWQVLPVTKRPRNPFPQRITVGRATNCDLVLRVPSVSKVHAHIVCEAGGPHYLQDNRPSNATFLNNERLAPGESRALRIGDLVRFGPLEFEFVDAARLHEIVRQEASNGYAS